MIKVLIRVWNFFFGWLGLRVGDLEATSPEVVYQNGIDDLKRRYKEAYDAAGSVKARQMALAKRKAKLEESFTQAEQDLNLALDEKDEDLAREIIERQSQAKQELDDIQPELESATQDFSEAKKTLNDVKIEIEKLKSRKTKMVSRLKTAQAKEALKASLDGLSTSANTQAIEDLEGKIEEQYAKSSLGDELKEESTDGKLRKLRQKAVNRDVEAKLAEAKAAREQKKVAS